MKIYTDIEQWSETWRKIRAFKLTASNALTISIAWKWLETLVLKTVADWFAKEIWEWYTGIHTERWKELEPIAREIYELETWNTVTQVWFIEYSETIWASPDWLIWEDWLIEIKCKDNHTFFELLLWWKDKIEKWYYAQMQMQMYVSWRKWVDFVCFNPNYEKSLIIHRIKPDLDFFKKLEYWLEVWTNKIKNLKKQYESTKIS